MGGQWIDSYADVFITPPLGVVAPLGETIVVRGTRQMIQKQVFFEDTWVIITRRASPAVGTAPAVVPVAFL